MHGEEMPKQEKMPTMLHLSEDDLPEIKNWKVGQMYTIHLNVKQVGSRLEDYGPHKGKVFASFHIHESEAGSEKKLSKRY